MLKTTEEPPLGGYPDNCSGALFQLYLKGFEPLAHGLEGRCSIRLSYRYKAERGIPANRGNRIRTCDLLVPNQAR